MTAGQFDMRFFFFFGFIGCFLTSLAARIVADEVVLGMRPSQTTTVGDIDLTPGVHGFQAFQSLQLGSSGLFMPQTQVTAGELWTFFEEQGLHSVDRIVLYMDVGQLEQADSVTIQSLEFRIEDLEKGQTVTSRTLGEDNSLLIPGYETAAHLPVARMEIELGYDFMQRFTSSSPEQVYFNVEFDSTSGSRPTFYVEGKRRWLSSANVFLLVAFVLFWTIVFYVLKKLTLGPATQVQRTTAG